MAPRVVRAAQFQSTRPVRGATMGQAAREADGWISIHAPRAGRDIYLVPQVGVLFVISIHAPRAGRDSIRLQLLVMLYPFQSTRPVRGATSGAEELPAYGLLFQSTRPVRGATFTRITAPFLRIISIHAPRAGRDEHIRYITDQATGFQSTRPVRGATKAQAAGREWSRHFNPRAPCGARPGIWPVKIAADPISIHAPRAGRDTSQPQHSASCRNFNPRAPCGARLGLRLSNPCRL